MSEFSARGTCLSGITLIRRIRTQSFGGWIFAIIVLNFYNTSKLDIQKKKKKKKGDKEGQGVPQSQTTANLRHQGEEKNGKNWHVQNKQTNAREAQIPAPSFPNEVIIMLKGMIKHEDKEHGKT